MSHVFISYARKDGRDFAVTLARFFSTRGLPYWRDEERIGPGAAWRTEIRNALDVAYALVVVVSPASVKSQYVDQEVTTYENVCAARNVAPAIFPVLTGDLNLADLPLYASTRQWVDVRNRTHFTEALDKLVRSLAAIRATAPTPDAPTVTIAAPRSTLEVIGALDAEMMGLDSRAESLRDSLAQVRHDVPASTDWREAAYDSISDQAIARLTLTNPDPRLREEVAFTVAHLRSSAAITYLMRVAESGETASLKERAVQALVGVREAATFDGAPVPSRVRRHVFWTLSGQQLFRYPLALVGRYVGATLGAMLGIGVALYLLNDTLSPSARLFTALAVGTQYGVLLGAGVTAATEIGTQLRAWSAPARVGMAWVVGAILAAVALTMLDILFFGSTGANALLAAALFAAGFALPGVVVRVPRRDPLQWWLRALIAAGGIVSGCVALSLFANVPGLSTAALIAIWLWIALAGGVGTFLPEIFDAAEEALAHRRHVGGRA
jgi:hypothetical protein